LFFIHEFFRFFSSFLKGVSPLSFGNSAAVFVRRPFASPVPWAPFLRQSYFVRPSNRFSWFLVGAYELPRGTCFGPSACSLSLAFSALRFFSIVWFSWLFRCGLFFASKRCCACLFYDHFFLADFIAASTVIVRLKENRSHRWGQLP